MSWLGLIVSHSAAEQQGTVMRDEEVARLSLIVEERSFIAHIKKKLRNVIKTGADSSSDDDGDTAAADQGKKRAKPKAPSSLLLKYKLVAERRQIEWDLYEERCRDLRRQYDMTHDDRFLTQMESLAKPNAKKKSTISQKTESSVCAAGVSTAAAADDAARRRDKADLVPILLPQQPAASTASTGNTVQEAVALPHPTEVADPPLYMKQAFRDEGFSRASLVMEERSARQALSNKFKLSLIEGDDALRAAQWNRECYTRELDVRALHRHEAELEEKERKYQEIANQYRSITSAQTNRVFVKKMLRERRVALQVEESTTREDIALDWGKWFNISIVCMNFSTIMKIIPEEELVKRAKILGDERRGFERFIIRYQVHLRRVDELATLMELAFAELYDAESESIQLHIAMYHKQLREIDLEEKRRYQLRQMYLREDIERLKLEAKLGAPNLTTTPGVPTGGNILALQPEDELEMLLAKHPHTNISEAVSKTRRMNQENNRLYMTLERRHVTKAGTHVESSPSPPPPQDAVADSNATQVATLLSTGEVPSKTASCPSSMFPHSTSAPNSGRRVSSVRTSPVPGAMEGKRHSSAVVILTPKGDALPAAPQIPANIPVSANEFSFMMA